MVYLSASKIISKEFWPFLLSIRSCQKRFEKFGPTKTKQKLCICTAFFKCISLTKTWNFHYHVNEQRKQTKSPQLFKFWQICLQLTNIVAINWSFKEHELILSDVGLVLIIPSFQKTHEQGSNKDAIVREKLIFLLGKK